MIRANIARLPARNTLDARTYLLVFAAKIQRSSLVRSEETNFEIVIKVSFRNGVREIGFRCLGENVIRFQHL